MVFKHNALPFHNRAVPAAMASECAREQGKFWEMHDKIFTNVRALEDADLEGHAKSVGLNMGNWKSCYTSNKHKARLDADQKQATLLGARGTPAFFINGRFLSGAQPYPAFEALVEEELKKAKATGLSGSDYYAKEIEAKGLKKP